MFEWTVRNRATLYAGIILFLASLSVAHAQTGVATNNADARAAQWVKQMPPSALHQMVQSYAMMGEKVQPLGSVGAAGYVPALPSFGIPALQENDAGIGVNNYLLRLDALGRPVGIRGDAGNATPLPSLLGLAASWNPDLAYTAGAMIAGEAHAQGINVLLAGGVNLARDPRNGRNFEYFGEDPLLAGTMAGAEIRGIQSEHVISTIKHFALNDQETNRLTISANLNERAFRESDLFAFELAIEGGQPGAVMCGYNKVNGVYACSNHHLLSDVLKRDWKYPGWVMTDWGADQGPTDALAGVDQVSGLDPADGENGKSSFGAPLMQEIKTGAVSPARLQDMARRILRSMIAVGLFEYPPVIAPLDVEKDAEVARNVADQTLVLLKNDRDLLPLDRHVKTILLVGGHADKGVLSGGGAAQVWPIGGPAIRPVHPNLHDSASPWIVYDPSSPLTSLQGQLPASVIRYDDGTDKPRLAKLAKSADVVIVFATQWAAEGIDAPNLSLPDHQDALITTVAAINPHTVVVLETGGPVLMPWLAKVGAVIEAWYPGARGADAIADILSGRVNPSGRLPITFPQSERQLPRPHIDQGDAVNYNIEGAAVGYKWYDEKAIEPLFPFGYGLSYTHFGYSDLTLQQEHGRVLVRFTLTNKGNRSGAETAQVYVDMSPDTGEAPRRLAAFEKVTLAPGERKAVTVAIDPRLFATFDVKNNQWFVHAGRYGIQAGSSSRSLPLQGEISLDDKHLAP